LLEAVMKTVVVSAIALLGLTAAWPAAAQMYGGGNVGAQTRDYNTPRAMTPEQRREQERNKKLAALRKDGLKMQKQDGGTLSADHKAQLEARMAEINAAYPAQTAAAAPQQ
jgi:hypothetical protein